MASSSPSKVPDSEWSIAASMPEELEDLDELEAGDVTTKSKRSRQDEVEATPSKKLKVSSLASPAKSAAAEERAISPTKTTGASTPAIQPSPAKVHVKKQIFMPGCKWMEPAQR